MTLNELKSSSSQAHDSLIIHSHEGGIYTLQVTVNGKMSPLELEEGKAGIHDSLEGIKLKMKGVDFNEVYLIQQTPYDEMIGLPSVTEPLKQPLSWST